MMMQKATKEELLAQAKKPSEDAMIMHSFYRGKMQTVPRAVIRDYRDFAIWYTPGVAAPCKAIQADKDKAYEYTSKWNTVAVVSDGTRVLGLGNIGPEAAMPVMEGKAMLFKYLGGVDAVAVCLDTRDPEEIIRTVKIIQPSFGGINLEDIENPKCFHILDTLRKECHIPVWHDDQQGTAAVTLAGIINALKVVNKDMKKVKVAMIGVGAANVAIIRLMLAAGFKQENMIIVDSKATLHRDRKDLEEKQASNPYKWDLAKRTNPDMIKGGIAEALAGRDVVLSLSTPDPETIKPAWLKKMNKNSIGFFCANPLPEIWPWDAKEAGLRIVATGRSDFPNQVNNSIGFPAIFRGTLDVKARTITDEMCIAAAYELAKFAEEQGLNDDHIIPSMADTEVFVREAVAVGMKAIEQGVARENITREELARRSGKIIREAKQTVETLMKTGMIPPAPKGV
jgi:malate dehydrogenase (oxaloacetate-decarboxylating)